VDYIEIQEEVVGYRLVDAVVVETAVVVCTPAVVRTRAIVDIGELVVVVYT
jgi:hypothetical protein